MKRLSLEAMEIIEIGSIYIFGSMVVTLYPRPIALSPGHAHTQRQLVYKTPGVQVNCLLVKRRLCVAATCPTCVQVCGNV